MTEPEHLTLTIEMTWTCDAGLPLEAQREKIEEELELWADAHAGLEATAQTFQIASIESEGFHYSGEGRCLVTDVAPQSLFLRGAVALASLVMKSQQ